MANLLPTTERTQLNNERLRRLGVAALVGCIITLAIGGVLFVPAYFSATVRERATQKRLDALTQLIALKQGEAGDTEIQKTQERLELLATALDARVPSELLQKTMDAMSPGITIWQYVYTAGEGNTTVSISGRATNRATLLAFGDALRTSGLFLSVDIPISSLARSEDIAFTLSMQLVDTQP